jgi:hypothetical protein
MVTHRIINAIIISNDDLPSAPIFSLTMVEDKSSRVWSVLGDSLLNSVYDQYQMTVYHPQSKKVETLITTDPYSLCLLVNSQYLQAVDLDDSSTQPEKWQYYAASTVKMLRIIFL